MLDWTVGKVLEWSTSYLQKNEIDSPKRTAELLLGHSLSMSRVDLYLRYQQPLTAEELAAYKGLLKRRAKHEPTQYILESQEFWSLPFYVDARVLIPRPETECLVEEACKLLKSRPVEEDPEGLPSPGRPKKTLRWNEDEPEIAEEDEEDEEETSDIKAQAPVAPRKLGEGLRFLDLCTGSGALACALASEFPGAKIWATDISKDAVAVARKNIDALTFSERIKLTQGDLLETVRGERFDVIVSNPPYIRSEEMTDLQREVRDYEPHLALEAGTDGLDVVRRIVREAPQFLVPGGWLMFEIGSSQGQETLALFEGNEAYSEVSLRQDYARLDRYIVARTVR
ncbi:MAG: peptide chain release factor N(5)-glutamine methyltransferase [Myxococcales bacterium]|nr:peptide chain release factor N(5)-glutamine methyltransferase [Myxococcales bacterium]